MKSPAEYSHQVGARLCEGLRVVMDKGIYQSIVEPRTKPIMVPDESKGISRHGFGITGVAIDISYTAGGRGSLPKLFENGVFANVRVYMPQDRLVIYNGYVILGRGNTLVNGIFHGDNQIREVNVDPKDTLR